MMFFFDDLLTIIVVGCSNQQNKKIDNYELHANYSVFESLAISNQKWKRLHLRHFVLVVVLVFCDFKALIGL